MPLGERREHRIDARRIKVGADGSVGHPSERDQGHEAVARDRPFVIASGDDDIGGHPLRLRPRFLGRRGGDLRCQRRDRRVHRDRRRRFGRPELLVEGGQQGSRVHGSTTPRRGDVEGPVQVGRYRGVHGHLVDPGGKCLHGLRQLVAVVGNRKVESDAVDRGLGRTDEVGDRLALAARHERRVDQRRRVWSAADVGVADGRRLGIRPGEGDLSRRQRHIGVRDLRLRLLPSESTEFRAADANAGQDPALVLLAPCVQDTAADADGEQEAQDERDAEAKGERPSAPSRCRGFAVGRGGRHERRDRGGIDAGLRGRRGVRRGGVGQLAWHERIAGGGARIGRVGRLVAGRCPTDATDERRKLGVAGGRLAVGRGGVGSLFGRGIGQLGHSEAHVGWACAGVILRSRDIFARAGESVTPRSTDPSTM